MESMGKRPRRRRSFTAGTSPPAPRPSTPGGAATSPKSPPARAGCSYHRHRHRLPPRRRPRDGRSPAHRAPAAALANAVAARDPAAGTSTPTAAGPYTSAQFAELASHCEVVLSHGRTGQCWDDALAESFFGAIKGELLDDRAWPARAAARRAVSEYIAWHNGTRLHSSVGYKPPAEYEAIARQENLKYVARQATRPGPQTGQPQRSRPANGPALPL